MQIFKTKKEQEPIITEKIDDICQDAWIRLYEPSETELATVSEKCSIPPEFLKAALDEEERPRIDAEDEVVLIVMDIPVMTEFEEIKTLTTHPLGIIIARDYLVTVCSRKSQVLDDFVAGEGAAFYYCQKDPFHVPDFLPECFVLSQPPSPDRAIHIPD